MPTSTTAGTTTNCQPTPTAMPRPMTTGTVTESSIETKVERVSWMRARTPPLTETAALTCPSSRPQPRPTPAAPSERHREGWRPGQEEGRQRRGGERREVDGADPEAVVEAMAEEAGADHAHGHGRRVQARLRVGQGQGRGQEGRHGSDHVDQVADGPLVQVGAAHVGQPRLAPARGPRVPRAGPWRISSSACPSAMMASSWSDTTRCYAPVASQLAVGTAGSREAGSPRGSPGRLGGLHPHQSTWGISESAWVTVHHRARREKSSSGCPISGREGLVVIVAP